MSASTIEAILPFFMALIFIAGGVPLVMRKTPMNPAYGFRFPQSFKSERNWYAINAYGGKCLLIWSVPILGQGVYGWFRPDARPWFPFVLLACVALIGTQSYMYARRVDKTSADAVIGPSPNNSSVTERLVLWIVWAVFAGSLVFYRFSLVTPHHNTQTLTFPTDPSTILQFAIPASLSIAARWILMPSLRVPFLALVPFLFGMAISEALTFFGLFLSPAHFNSFFVTNCILMLMWMPLWKRNGEPAPPPNPRKSSGR